jgi:hypothetical protein
LLKRVEKSYVKYGWTKEQREFDRVMKGFANYRNPENTLHTYLDLLNQVVLKLKNPFSEMTYDDLVPLLSEWQEMYGEYIAWEKMYVESVSKMGVW